MMKILITIVFLAAQAHFAFSQKLTISGTVRDAANGELLVGATIADSLSQTGVQTNAYGFFSLEIPSPDHRNLIL